MDPDKELLARAATLLSEWYARNKRTLPWRGTRDPYRILVSEIMLQQTRVEAVKGYYLRFLERFPTAEALASAEEEDVLKAWEGLGYYVRARNLKRAAERVAKEGFPRTLEGVRALPGVGDYTAGAICSIAYDLPCPAVDGNVLRVLSRLLADGRKADAAAGAHFSALLRDVYPPEAGDFCQALMELGAIVCLPNGDPLCEECPWGEICRARLSGREGEFPVRAEKKERKIVRLFVYVLRREGKFALEKRPQKGLLAGLWQFPNGEEDAHARYGVAVERRKAKHVFTHVEWRMTGYLIDAPEFFPQFVWATPEEAERKYALPNAFKAFRDWVK